MKKWLVFTQKPLPDKKADPRRYQQCFLADGRTPAEAVQNVKDFSGTVWPVVQVLPDLATVRVLVA